MRKLIIFTYPLKMLDNLCAEPAVLHASPSGLEAEVFQTRRLLGQWMGLGQGQPACSSSPLLNLLNLIIWGRLFAFLPRPCMFTPYQLYCNGNCTHTGNGKADADSHIRKQCQSNKSLLSASGSRKFAFTSYVASMT